MPAHRGMSRCPLIGDAPRLPGPLHALGCAVGRGSEVWLQGELIGAFGEDAQDELAAIADDGQG